MENVVFILSHLRHINHMPLATDESSEIGSSVPEKGLPSARDAIGRPYHSSGISVMSLITYCSSAAGRQAS